MTQHLNAEERIDALDGVLDQRRLVHLDECAPCREEVAGLRQVWSDVTMAAEGDVPEPSPLFWDHFQHRVGTAVNAVELAVATPWWGGSTRAWVALAAAAVVVMAVTLAPGRVGWFSTAPAEDAATAHAGEFAGDQVQWQFVTDVLVGLEQETVHEILEPSPVAIDAAFASLSAAERDAFARLLQAELTEGSE